MLKTMFNVFRYKREIKGRMLFSHPTLQGYKGCVKTHPFEAILDRVKAFIDDIKASSDTTVSKDPKRKKVMLDCLLTLCQLSPAVKLTSFIYAMQFTDKTSAISLLAELERDCTLCRNLIRDFNYHNVRYFASIDQDEQYSNAFEHELDEILNYYSLELQGIAGFIAYCKAKYIH